MALRSSLSVLVGTRRVREAARAKPPCDNAGSSTFFLITPSNFGRHRQSRGLSRKGGSSGIPSKDSDPTLSTSRRLSLPTQTRNGDKRAASISHQRALHISSPGGIFSVTSCRCPFGKERFFHRAHRNPRSLVVRWLQSNIDSIFTTCTSPTSILNTPRKNGLLVSNLRWE